jgi:hypothetical protein
LLSEPRKEHGARFLSGTLVLDNEHEPDYRSAVTCHDDTAATPGVSEYFRKPAIGLRSGDRILHCVSPNRSDIHIRERDDVTHTCDFASDIVAASVGTSLVPQRHHRIHPDRAQRRSRRRDRAHRQ